MCFIMSTASARFWFFVFLLLFAGGLRLRFGKNALRLFAFPENGLVQPFRKAFPIISPNDGLRSFTSPSS